MPSTDHIIKRKPGKATKWKLPEDSNQPEKDSDCPKVMPRGSGESTSERCKDGSAGTIARADSHSNNSNQSSKQHSRKQRAGQGSPAPELVNKPLPSAAAGPRVL